MKRVLITESIAPEAIPPLRAIAQVDIKVGLSPQELLDCIGKYDGLVVRSRTQVTAPIIEAGKRLSVIGRAGIGVDNIDLTAATRRGIMVVNVPSGNTIAVAEHTIGLMLALTRHIPQADASLRAGRWEKSKLTGIEVRGKTLGLIGLGRIGRAVARRAVCMEMEIIAHDPFVSPDLAARENVRLVELDELLRTADFVSIHTPLTAQTRGLLDAEALALLKPTARIVNCARGGIIDEEALCQALQAGRIAGAALDVFEHEPLDDSPLLRNPRVILTPHLGASTEEARMANAVEISAQVADILAGKPPRFPVNAPFLSSEAMAALRPYLDLAQRLGCLYAQTAGANLISLDIAYAGEIAATGTELLTAALLIGVLGSTSDEPVNLINARILAEGRGIAVSERRTSETTDLENLITLTAETTRGAKVVAGTLLRGEPHIVRIDDFWVDFVAEGLLLISEHVEQPGIIGHMGMLLGDAGINIHFVQVGRRARGGRGVMVVGIDDALTESVLEQVHQMPSIRAAYVVDLAPAAFADAFAGVFDHISSSS